MSKYDIFTKCPICGKPAEWINGSTNNGLVYIKSKRRTVNVYHEKCIYKEMLSERMKNK